MSNMLYPMTEVVLFKMVDRIVLDLLAAGYPVTFDIVMLLLRARIKRIDEFHNP